MDDARIEVLKIKLAESKVIPKAEVDALADDLEFAQTINGDPDPTRQMMKRGLISGVRREMLAHERHAQASKDFAEMLGSALKRHEETCKLASLALAARESEQDRKPKTYLSFKVGEKTVTAGGWAAAVLAVGTVIGLLMVVQSRAAKAAAEEATQAMVRAYLGKR